MLILVKKNKKNSKVVMIIIGLIIFYYMLRVTTLVSINNGDWNLQYFSDVLNNIYRIDTTLIITKENLLLSGGITFFIFALYETYRLQNKKNIQEDTYGSAEWRESKDIEKKKDKTFENNMILTQSELISKNMKISEMNRHVILLGRPGTRKI